jgi:hypothetical protein
MYWSVCHAGMLAIGPSGELLCEDAFFQGQCSRCDSRRLRRRDSIGTSSFLLISFKRWSDDSHSPSRWKQWSHTASDIRDSTTPDQPNSANVKATMSVGDEGSDVAAVPDELNRLDGRRWRMSCTDGLGYVMFSRSGRSAAVDWNDW